MDELNEDFNCHSSESKTGKGKLLGFVDKQSLLAKSESLTIADFPTCAPLVWLRERAKNTGFRELLLGSSTTFNTIAVFYKDIRDSWLIYIGKRDQLDQYTYNMNNQVDYGIGITTLCRNALSQRKSYHFLYRLKSHLQAASCQL
jgi:hypothetical protein